MALPLLDNPVDLFRSAPLKLGVEFIPELHWLGSEN
jgi:hypothetical protein